MQPLTLATAVPGFSSPEVTFPATEAGRPGCTLHGTLTPARFGASSDQQTVASAICEMLRSSPSLASERAATWMPLFTMDTKHASSLAVRVPSSSPSSMARWKRASQTAVTWACPRAMRSNRTKIAARAGQSRGLGAGACASQTFSFPFSIVQNSPAS